LIFSFHPLLHWPSLNKTQASGSALIQALWSAILTVLRRRLKPRVGYLNPWGNADPTCSLANFGEVSTYNADCVSDTSATGAYPAGASPYGALDMAGNVLEWVNDWYDGSYYGNSPASNPQGPSSGTVKVLRGGAWDLFAEFTLTTHRERISPDNSGDYIGFRCARSAP